MTSYTWHNKNGQVMGTLVPPTHPDNIALWDQSRETVIVGEPADPNDVLHKMTITLSRMRQEAEASKVELTVHDYINAQAEYYRQYTRSSRENRFRRVVRDPNATLGGTPVLTMADVERLGREILRDRVGGGANDFILSIGIGFRFVYGENDMWDFQQGGN